MKRLLILMLMLAGVAHASVLKFTANNVTVHYHDDIPPLTWSNTEFAGTDTWSDAVASGYPSCTTTYTNISPAGTYPVTCSVGSLVAKGSYTFSFFPGTITVEDPATAPVPVMGAATVVVQPQPKGMMQNMTVTNSSCAALVSGGTVDNTVAFNCFLNTGRMGTGTTCSAVTYGKTPKQFYLPAGVYLVTGTLTFCGSAITVTGDGWNKSIIKLAASSVPSDTPSPFIFFPGGFAGGSNNNGFNEHFENIGVEVGPGNPGATGVEFIGNNFDAVRNVRVWFDDSKGVAAFSVDKAYPGQTLFKNIAGYGGSYCFTATSEQEYNSVIYNLTCENQAIAGVTTGPYNLESSSYFSVNSVPAWTSVSGAEVLLGAELIGNSSANTAITNGSIGTFYARNIFSTGYQHVMVDSNGGGTPIDAGFKEHWSGTPNSLFSSGTPTGIIIPNPPDTPVASDPDPSTWCPLDADPKNWTENLKSVNCKSTTAYVPVACNYTGVLGAQPDCSQIATQTGIYSFASTDNIMVVVPGNIHHIMGNNYSTSASVINWVIGGTKTDPPLVLDHFNSAKNQPIVSHDSSRTLVFEDAGLSYSCTPGAGDVYFEDAQISDTSFCTGQHIYARALDDEAEGEQLAVQNVGYVSATHTLTLTLAADPGTMVGSYLYFGTVSPATWLKSTPAVVTSITSLSSTVNMVTATWYGTQADYPPTPQTGNYRVQFDKVTGTGINLWVLGWKSEKASTDLNIVNGNVEIDGFFQYPLRPSPPEWPGFKFTDTNYFITGQSFYGGGTQVDSQRQYFVTETRSGVTLSLNNPAYGLAKNANLNMLYSIGAVGPMTAQRMTAISPFTELLSQLGIRPKLHSDQILVKHN